VGAPVPIRRDDLKSARHCPSSSRTRLSDTQGNEPVPSRSSKRGCRRLTLLGCSLPDRLAIENAAFKVHKGAAWFDIQQRSKLKAHQTSTGEPRSTFPQAARSGPKRGKELAGIAVHALPSQRLEEFVHRETRRIARRQLGRKNMVHRFIAIATPPNFHPRFLVAPIMDVWS
jgi:hypothetical protein